MKKPYDNYNRYKNHFVFTKVLLIAILLAPGLLGGHITDKKFHTHPFGATDLPPDPAVVFGKLDSGLQYAIMPNRHPPERVSLRLLIRAGSLHEQDDQRGLAHYLEHMAFQGTENFAAGTLVEYFQKLGMSFGPDANAYTGFDRTVYQIELPDNKTASVGDALLVLRDFADRMKIAETEVEKERDVILSEKRTRDSIGFRTALAEFDFLLPEAVFAKRFPIGKKEVILNAGRDELMEFYKDWYRPELTDIIVAGDIAPEKVKQLIAGVFSGYEARRPKPAIPDRGQVAKRGITALLHKEPESVLTRVSIQCVHPLEQQPDTLARRRKLLKRSVALKMLDRRLVTLAQQEGAPFSRGTAGAYDLFDFFSNASINLFTQPGKWDAALTVAEQELRRALVHGFHESELQEARLNMRNAFEENARRAPTRNSRNLAQSLASSLTTGKVFMDPHAELEITAPLLENLTVEKCRNALRKIFPYENRFIFITGDIELENPEEMILSVYHKASAEEVMPAEEKVEPAFAYILRKEPGEIAEKKYCEHLDLYRIRLENNVRVNVKKTDFRSNQILLAARIGGGQLTETRPGLGKLASATMIRGGLGEHSHDALQRIFAGHNVGWSFSVEPDAFVFRGTTTAADFKLQLKLLRAYLLDPGFRHEALQHARDGFEEKYIAAETTPEGMLKDRVTRFLAGGDPRFGLPPRDKLRELDLEDVRQWLVQPLERDMLELSIVGDIATATGAVAAVAATLGTLPERQKEKPRYEAQRRLSRPDPGERQRFEFQSRIPNGYSVIYWPIPDHWEVERTRRLNILSRVFTDRMRLRIREEMGKAYSAYAVSHPSDTYSEYGWLYAIVAVAPEKATTVAEAILEIAGDLHSGNISEDEHQRALRPVLASLRETVRDNRYWMNSVLISAQEHPQRLEWGRTMLEDFETISVEELKELARVYLNPHNAVPVLIVPAAVPGD